MTDLTKKILDTMEQQNGIIAKLKADNEQLKQQVSTERSHKKAYQTRLRELEPPPNERQEQSPKSQVHGYTYNQEEFWDSLNDLSEDEQYKTLKNFLKDFNTLWDVVTHKLAENFREKYKKEYNELKQQLKQVESEKPKTIFERIILWVRNFFGMENKEKQQKISSLKSKLGISKLHYNSYDPTKENKELREKSLQHMYNESKLKDLRARHMKAKSFVEEYEKRNSKEW